MMRISLNGDNWVFKNWIDAAFLRDDQEIADGLANDERGWHSATVPGSVQHDLWRCGEIPNPYYERNTLLAEWVPERTWVYKKVFSIDPAHRGKQAQLHFAGVDYEARFFLNGVALGQHRSMFTPATFDVTTLLHWDAPNVVAVVLAPAPREQGQLGRTSLVRTHKTRMNYWWDFCPRMVHVGIWDAVTLFLTGPVRIEDVWVQPQLSDDLQRASGTVTCTLCAVRPTMVVVEVLIQLDGQMVLSRRVEREVLAGQSDVIESFEITEPQLWWPNGYGTQPLYQAQVRVVDQAELGETSDQRTVTFGLRQVELVANDTPDTTAPPYTFVVNGLKLYINGWNWVPLDVLYGVEQPAKLERLLTLAQQAHVNLLRVNGVGLIEKEAFYDLCDQRGIMVWQEFILSSSALDRKPADDPEFISMVVADARQIVPGKRHHPSLVIWGGGNELESLAKLPLDDSEPVLGALHDVVRTLDPDRHWLPTSAFGRKPFNGLSSIANDPYGLHDVHGPWFYEGLTDHYTLYNRGTSLFHTEFGAEGLTNLKTLHATLSPARCWPVTLDDPVWRHLGAWWVRSQQWHDSFGPCPDLVTMVRATQFLQAEGVRYAIEANRRRMYQNSGSLPWQLNEPYPMAACTSAVDYFAQPKPLYYAVARAYAPLQVSASYATLAWANRTVFEAELWVVNAHNQRFDDAVLEARIVDAQGTAYVTEQIMVACQPNSATNATALRWDLALLHEDIFLLDVQLMDHDGGILATNRYPFSRTHNLAPLLHVPQTTLEVHKEIVGDQWTVTLTNSGRHTALFVQFEDGRDSWADGYSYFDANHVCLLPNEQRPFTVAWTNVVPEEQQLTISAWNAVTVHLEPQERV